MRQIKFRAWDKELKVMRYRWINVVPDSKHAWAWGKNDEDLEGANKEERRYFTDTLMQFTGLYSKSGQPIYEGDIVNGEVGTWDGPFQVLFDYGGWELKNKYGQGESLYLEKVEVIGNIYENPELIKNSPYYDIIAVPNGPDDFDLEIIPCN